MFKTILNTFQSSAVSYKNQFCGAKQMTGFYKKRNTELKWVKGKDKLQKTLTIEAGKAAHTWYLIIQCTHILVRKYYPLMFILLVFLITKFSANGLMASKNVPFWNSLWVCSLFSRMFMKIFRLILVKWLTGSVTVYLFCVAFSNKLKKNHNSFD